MIKLYLLALSVLATCSSFNLNAETNTIDKRNQIVIFYQEKVSSHKKIIPYLNKELKIKMPKQHFRFIDITNLTKKEIDATLERTNSCAMGLGSLTIKKMLSVRKPIHYFSLLVPRHRLDRLNRIYAKLGIKLTGIYDEQPFARQLYLSKAINPKLTSVAILLDQSDKYYLPEYQSIANNNHIKLNYRILKPSDSPEKYLEEIATKNTYLVITNNKQLASKSKLAALVLSAFYQHIKLIGNRYENVKIGTLASIYTPAAMLASEASEQFKNLCLTNKVSTPRYASHFSVAINQQIAENMNMETLNSSTLTRQILNREKP